MRNTRGIDCQLRLTSVPISRPKTVDEVAYQDEVVATLKKSLETGNVSLTLLIKVLILTRTCSTKLPHLLFYGPPGTGKTSTILAIGKDLYG